MNIKEIHDTQIKKSTLKWNTYFDIYETHFAKYVNKNPTVLEIGVAKGGSLEMWSKYFVNGEIHGLDINEKIMKYTFDEKNIFCHLGNQGDPKYWEHFNQNVDMRFDVIIDDGSHINSHQILTILNLWPRLNEGGTYLIEDTHTSYWDWATPGGQEYGGGYRKDGAFIESSKDLIDFLHRQFNGVLFPDIMKQVFEDLYSITYYNSVVVFTKKKHVIMEPYGVNVDPNDVF